ncbi:membrane AbrB-like protein [Kroppenstedtia sanguinis]|uniref:AbrB family transcriptional regulator n=1 Tax=Kroppenstedtia sanguinis TaxID=1380684 RepID=UPI003D2348B7
MSKKVTSISKEYRRDLLPWLRTFLLAVTGGTLFAWIQIPLPWVLGPMVMILLWSKTMRFPLHWSGRWRNAGLLAIGYTLGTSFTQETMWDMVTHLPLMLLVTIITIGCGAGIAWLVSRWTDLNYRTTLTANIPGGLSQMVALGEEMPGIDITVVTLFQVTRLLIVVFIVPFLIKWLPEENVTGILPGTAGQTPTLADELLFGLAALLAAGAAWKLKFPTPFLMGPVLAVALLQVLGFEAPALPPLLIHLGQMFMGAHLGLMIRPEQLTQQRRVPLLSLFTALVLIVITFGISCLFTLWSSTTLTTSFLSLAPGGMAEMGVVAQDIGADLAIVTGFQMFRVFFILIFVPPFLRWLFKKSSADDSPAPHER